MITFNEHYVMDKNGNRVGVFLDIADYRKILEKLEELESIHASDTVKASRGEVIPSEQADDETEAEAQDWRALCGKYRDVLTPTEQFFREKQEEIELKERKLMKTVDTSVIQDARCKMQLNPES
jgi:hypothetical protein